MTVPNPRGAAFLTVGVVGSRLIGMNSTFADVP
jgi:hypothetical protein